MTPIEERLAVLEENVKFMASVVSRQSGEIQAFHAALHGFLIFAGDIGEIRTQIELELEKCAASNLGTSTNQDRLDGFDSAASVLRAAMSSMDDRITEQDGYKSRSA